MTNPWLGGTLLGLFVLSPVIASATRRWLLKPDTPLLGNRFIEWANVVGNRYLASRLAWTRHLILFIFCIGMGMVIAVMFTSPGKANSSDQTNHGGALLPVSRPTAALIGSVPGLLWWAWRVVDSRYERSKRATRD